MPITPLQVTETNPKYETLQFQEQRIQGIPFKINPDAGVETVSNNRIVSLQEDTNGNRYAVTGLVALDYMTIIGVGVAEYALQSANTTIAPSPYVLSDGDQIVVNRSLVTTYAIDFESEHEPDVGIATATVDLQGRLTNRAADATHIQSSGSVFKSVPGSQLTGQLKTGCVFYQLKDALTA